MKRYWLLALALLLVGAVGIASADYIILITNVGLTKEKPPEQPGGAGGEGGAGRPQTGGYAPPGYAPPSADRGGPAVPPGGEGPGGVEQVFEDVGGTPYYVMAVVETIKPLSVDLHRYIQAPPPKDQPKQSVPFMIEHKWGRSYLSTAMFTDPASTTRAIFVRQSSNTLLPGLAQQYQTKYTEAHKGGKTTPKQLLELAEWTLGHGLLDKFADAMKELAKIDGKHPVVEAYKQVQENLNRPARESALEAWTGKDKLLEGYRVARKDKGHYTLLYQRDLNPSEMQARLDRLEDAFVSFFYWFALREKILPVPEHRLLVVVVPLKEFADHHRIFDSMPLTADGFFARRENLAVFSAESLDHTYYALRENSAPIFSKISKDQLLKGLNRFEDWSNDQLLDAHTKALVLKALEEESQLATVSHEGTRQLMAATGMLPRGVVAPEWIQFGLASFFETVKGAPWGGVGSPSQSLVEQHNYLFLFKQATGSKKLTALQMRKNLEGVVTDNFFRQAEGGKDRPALLKARAMSWALTYYLAHEKLDDLVRYSKELAKLPRDLEFDDKVLLNYFARAFGCMDIKTNKVDERKLEELARAWHNYINGTPLEMEDVLKEVRKALTETPKPDKGTKPPSGSGSDGSASRSGG